MSSNRGMEAWISCSSRAVVLGIDTLVETSARFYGWRMSMSIRRTISWSWFAVTCLCLSCGPALLSAQEIRQYGNQGGDSGGGGESSGDAEGGTYYPGQPQPETEQTSSEGRESASGEESNEGDSESAGSYRIRLHGEDDSEDDEQNDDNTSAEAPVDKPPSELYGGVIPGARDEVEHLKDDESSESSKPNRLTWLGFKPERDRTRIFLQTSRTPEYDVTEEDDGTIVVALEDTNIAARNFSRTIDASYFNRNVRTIRARPRGERVRIEIDMQESESPSISTEGQYLYLDFARDSEETSPQQANRSARGGG